MWWDDGKIDSTVNRQFVSSHLHPEEQARLDQKLEFGDGLTDDTYLEWILQKAKRIFLILVDLGVPEQIFGVVNDSWDDEDLPIALDQIDRLQLTVEKDGKFERKFYHRQYEYLIRHLTPGENVFYQDDEVVPLEQVDKRPVVGLVNTNLDKVYLPSKPHDIFLRQKIPLGLGLGRMPQEEFLAGLERKNALEHKHLFSIWASYIHQGNGYVLLTPVNDGSLKSILTVTPASIKILAKQDRRALFLTWIHCLSSAIAFLHSQGTAHCKLRPSNIMMDIDNGIFLADSGIFTDHLSTEAKKSFDKELYDYAAPEQWHDRPSASSALPRSNSNRNTHRPQTRSSPPTSRGPVSSEQSAAPANSSSLDMANYPVSPNITLPHMALTSRHDTLKSDIFSLGCIFLDILTILLKRPHRSFVSHRSAKNKTPGRGGGLPDSSFHKNLGQVEIWIEMLAKDASKKEDRLFRGVSHILSLVTRMLAPNPYERPDAQYVRDRLGDILQNFSGIKDLCCSNSIPGQAICRDLGKGVAGLRINDSKEAVHAQHGRTSSGSSSDTVRVSLGSKNGRTGSVSTTEPQMAAGRAKPKVKAWQAPVYAG
jgi:serine/threonine protein kinase